MRLARYAGVASAAIMVLWAVHPATADDVSQPGTAENGTAAVISFAPEASNNVAPVPQPVAPPVSPNVAPVIQPVLESGDCAPNRAAGFIAHVDWLYWNYRSPSLTYADTQMIHGGGQLGIIEDRMSTPQNSGIRAGLGYRFNSDWDVTWNYTYFSASSSGSATAPPTVGLDSGSLAPPGTALAYPAGVGYSSVTAAASLSYNVHDLDIGRWLTWDDGLQMRVFGGFRWAMTNENIEEDFVPSFAFPGTSGLPFDAYGNHSTMNAFGVRIGSECRWRLSGTNLSLFGRGAGSVLLGDFQNNETVFDNNNDMVTVSHEDVHAVTVLEAAAGIAWETNNWEFSGGYELAAWLNQASIQDAVVFNPSNSYGTMLLDGFFFRAAYKY